jgi:hypothetical protein
MTTVIGIDNGSTGTIGILSDQHPPRFFPVPVKECAHYGRSKKGTTQRLDRGTLAFMLKQEGHDPATVRVFLERPFTGKFLNAVLPAHRFFEATLCVLEDLGLGRQTVDSRDWQKSFFPETQGSAELKRASMLRGIEMYPQFAVQIRKHGDADGLLIAHRFFYNL